MFVALMENYLAVYKIYKKCLCFIASQIIAH